MEIPCSWPLHIRSSIANELRLTHLTHSRTLLRRPLGGSYVPSIRETKLPYSGKLKDLNFNLMHMSTHAEEILVMEMHSKTIDVTINVRVK